MVKLFSRYVASSKGCFVIGKFFAQLMRRKVDSPENHATNTYDRAHFLTLKMNILFVSSIRVKVVLH